MKFLFDFFPVLLFFLGYKFYPELPASSVEMLNAIAPLGLTAGNPQDAMFFATFIAIVASVIQVGLYWAKHRRFETMHLVSLGLIVVFGGMTLALHDPLFFKWKPTILNWLFAIVFVGSHFIGRKPLIERLMSHAVSVPAPIWRNVNLAWALFFVALGVANLFVAYEYSEETWVNFKLFGLTGLTFAFVILQSFYLARYMLPEEAKQED